MTHRLVAHGWLSWLQVHALAGEATCAWADLGGFQVGQCPSDPPPYSHLWAWQAGRWLRVRLDGAEAVAASLVEGGSEGEAVSVNRRVVANWPEADVRVGPIPAALLQSRIELLTTLQPNPISFVHLTP